MKYLLPIGTILFLSGLFLAYFLHSDIWYSFFSIGVFLLLEGLNAPKGFSVFRNIKVFFRTWLVFALLGGVVEVIGNYWLHLWGYPEFHVLAYFIHVLLIGYPFTGFLGMELFKSEQQLCLPIFATVLGCLIEFTNTFAYEWKYANWPGAIFLGIPVLVLILWNILLLSLLFKKPFEFNI